LVALCFAQRPLTAVPCCFRQEALAHGLLPRRTVPAGQLLPTGAPPTVAQTYAEVRARAAQHAAGCVLTWRVCARRLLERPMWLETTCLVSLPSCYAWTALAAHPPTRPARCWAQGPRRCCPARVRRPVCPGRTDRIASHPCCMLRRAPERVILRRAQTHSVPLPTQLLRETGGGASASSSVRAAQRSTVPRLTAPPTLLCGALRRHRVLRGHRDAVYCAIFSASGSRVITGSDDYLVKIWNAHTGMLLHTCRGHEREITYVAASADDSLLASASIDAVIRTWRTRDGAPIAVLVGHSQAVTELAFHSVAGHLLMSCSTDGTVRLWDAARNATPPLVLSPGEQVDVNGADGAVVANTRATHICGAFSSDGALCASATHDFSIVLWCVDVGSCCAGGVPGAEEVSVVGRLRGHRNEVSFVQFGQHNALVSGGRDGTVRIWRCAAGEAGERRRSGAACWSQEQVLSPPPPPLQPGVRRSRAPPAVNMVRWCGEGGACVAAAMADASVCLWDARTGALAARLRRHAKEVYVVEPHPWEPRLLLTAGYDGRVCLWDLRGCCAAVAGSSSAPPEPAPLPVAEWDLRGCAPEEAMHLLDARWHPDGSRFVVSDVSGAVHWFGTGTSAPLRAAQTEQFFAHDYAPLLRDQAGWVADAQTSRPPHLTQRTELLCTADGTPYPEPYQSAFAQGTVLMSGAPVNDMEADALPEARVDLAAERRAAMPQSQAGPAAPGGPRRLQRISQGGGGGGGGPSAPPPSVFFRDDDSDEATSSDESDGSDGDGAPAVRGSQRQRQRDVNYLGEEELSAEDEDEESPASCSEEEEEDDSERGGGAGRARRSRRRVRTRAGGGGGESSEERRERPGRLLLRRRGAASELEAAQPVYATRYAGARRAAAMADSDGDGEEAEEEEEEEEEGGAVGEPWSDDASGERPPDPKRRRTAASTRPRRATAAAPARYGGSFGGDEDGQKRGEEGGEDEEEAPSEPGSDDADESDSARQRKRARDRDRRARNVQAREAERERRREQRRRRDGAASEPSDEDARPRAAPRLPPPTGFRAASKFAWLQRTERRRGEYVPQLGDAVVYLAQGHKEYLDSCGDARQSKPWTSIPGFRAAEPAVVTGLSYSIESDRDNTTVARLTLTLTDETYDLRGTRFELELPDMTTGGCPDFIVEHCRYCAAVSRCWSVGDRCLAWWPDTEADADGGRWWTATVWGVSEEESAWRGSPWNKLKVDYDNNDEPPYPHSCWELFDPVPSQQQGDGAKWVPKDDAQERRLSPELAATLQDALQGLCALEVNAWLLDAPPPELAVGRQYYCGRVPLPLGLHTLRRRVAGGYYRQADALRHDTLTLRNNALEVHGEQSALALAAVEACDALLSLLPAPAQLPELRMPGPPLPELLPAPRVVNTRSRGGGGAGPASASQAAAGGEARATTRALAAQGAHPMPGEGGRLSVRLRAR